MNDEPKKGRGRPAGTVKGTDTQKANREAMKRNVDNNKARQEKGETHHGNIRPTRKG